MIITGRENIEFMRLLALRSAIKLEVLGMKRRGRPATVIVREMLNLAKSTKKAEVLAALEAEIQKRRPV